MKVTRRAFFAAVGLLLTDPRKLLSKPRPRPVLTVQMYQRMINSVRLARRINFEHDFTGGRKIGDTIYVRRPRRFTVGEGREL